LRQKRRYGEYSVRIGNGQKFFLSPVDPTHAGVGLAFWAMPVSA
jgi:hypothetical protein